MVFLFIRLIPGDPARLVAGADATLEEVELLREYMGLNKPILIQYVDYMKGICSGNLGISLKTGDAVANMLLPRYKPTIMLAFSSMGWALVIGLTIGVFSAVSVCFWQLLVFHCRHSGQG